MPPDVDRLFSDLCVASTNGSIADEDVLVHNVPSALAVTAPAWALGWPARRAGARTASGALIPPPLAPLVADSAGAAASATAARAPAAPANAGGSSSDASSSSGSEAARPRAAGQPTGGAASGGSSPALGSPSSPAAAAAGAYELQCGKVAVPLGRAGLLAAFKQTSFSAPTPVRPGESLAAASPPGAACGGAGPAFCALSQPAAGGLRGEGHTPVVPAASWSSAFGGAAAAGRVQSWPLPPQAPGPDAAPHPPPAASPISAPGASKRAAAFDPACLSPLCELDAAAAAGGAAAPPDAAAGGAAPDGAAAAAAAWLDSALAAAGAGDDAHAWRYRFTTKWRRARRVHPMDRFDDSPDPLAFLAAHGAAATATLATGAAAPAGGAAAPAGGAAAPAGGAAAPAAPAAASPASRPPRLRRGGGGSRGGSAASSLAGSGPAGGCGLALPRVFSGGEMHRQLVAEAQRAHAALQQAGEAQQRVAAAAAAAAPPPAARGAEAEAGWAGPLLTGVRVDWGAVCKDTFVLVRASDATPGGRARSRLLLRARGGAAAPAALLAEAEAEARAAAAAARLPAPALALVGCGTLLKAGSGRLKVVCDAAPAGAGAAAPRGAAAAMAPGAVVSLAAALLRQAAPADWSVQQ
ncbi:MAG: hypothetical protein J3K34DRAFT_522806 [Monoraphidium minutum]|nr:MAG: hypothetical protein J3K34DRAFT_522806 [Monoraphidium minutum]